MRIIRFLGEDGRVHHGEAHGDGSATVLLDPQGVFGTPHREMREQIFRGLRALVADDDENMRRMMKAVLEKVGCACTVAADGAEAMEAIEGGALDMVVSDIIMPDHNGYEIFAAARRRRADMPVVLVTGFGYDPGHSLVRASSEGLTAVLYKPFTPQQLLDELQRAVHSTFTSPADTLQRSDQRLLISRALAPLEPRVILCVGPHPRPAEANEAPRAPDRLEAVRRASTAVTCSGQVIPVPGLAAGESRLECRGELAVIIGAEARGVSENEALRVVLGYTAAMNITAWRRGGGAGAAWEPDWALDIPCPLGPDLVTPGQIDAPDSLGIRTAINGAPVRDGPAARPGRRVASIVSALSEQATLQPATVILTGPGGGMRRSEPASLKAGDEVTVEIDGIGCLINRVAAV
jgi:2-keto-4-pentenoate hydratase/2-oxohepta-3-ene-1,7-dioic acid hydratase in catechol pathway